MRIHKASEPESITAPAKGVAADSDLGKATAEIKAALAGIPGTLEVKGGAKFGKGSLMVRWVNRENAKPGSLDWHNSPVSVTLWSHDFDASGKAASKVKVESPYSKRVRGKTGPLDVIVKYIIKSIKGLAETIPDDRVKSASNTNNMYEKANERMQRTLLRLAPFVPDMVRRTNIINVAQSHADKAFRRGERSDVPYPRKHYAEIETLLGPMSAKELRLFDDAYAAALRWNEDVNVKTSKTRRRASDLRSPAEKALGLESGELYGADEEVDTDMGSKMISGYKVEFTQNENTSSITAWVKGLGNISSDYSMDDLVPKVTAILKRVRAGEDLKAVKKDIARSAATTRLAKVITVLGNARTASHEDILDSAVLAQLDDLLIDIKHMRGRMRDIADRIGKHVKNVQKSDRSFDLLYSMRVVAKEYMESTGHVDVLLRSVQRVTRGRERVSTRVAAGPVKFKAEDLKKEFRDIDDATARAIVKLANDAHGNREADAAMQEINDLLGTYGVEAIEMEDAEGVPSYFHNSVAIYCNSGDTYNTTVLYDTVNRTWHLMSYGDFVEEYEQNRGADVD